ncbi:MAG: M13 family metallopeptidase [Bacteroidales bacterium]|nr:M13 family metallopeptidase [Bacteroidales bacterium]
MKKIALIMMTVMAAAGCCHRAAVPALDLSNLDTTVSPKVDFYRYSTGGWQEKNPLKPEFSRFGSFDVLNELNQKRLNDLFSEMATMTARPGTVEQKISDLYKMALDSVKRNADGASPIKDYIAEIEAIDSKEALVAKVASLQNDAEGAGFMGGYVEADLMDSDNQIFYIGQGGLGMGDRDYYIDPANTALKDGYRSFLAKIFTLAGLDRPAVRASNAVSVEDALAAVSWTRVQQRDIQAAYNPMSSKEIIEKWPGFHFDVWFQGRGIPEQEKVIVAEPSFFDGLSSIMENTPLDILKDYLLGMYISDAAGALDDEFYAASWDFFSRQMSGAKEQKPRWKRAMSVPNSLFGEAVGEMYVSRYFPESSKKKMVELVENLRTALGQHIDSLDWMSDTTKLKAREKLAAFTVKIGYPDKWKDYSTLTVDPALGYYENLRNAGRWYVADNMSKLGKPTDKTEWGMTPQTVNAYYNPTTNEICFPAAILQPPFFNPDADNAVNYGGIGVVIGHEMSHGFDDQGRLFDASGNMVNWWTAADEAAFKEKAEVLAAQFDEADVVPGVKANGHLTLGENIGDHGGISIAWTAMQNSWGGRHPEPIDGFTAEQRFWLSYGAIWAQNITPQEAERLTKLDVHSLARNRVNMSIRNFQQFFDAFDIKEGDPMFRPEEERVHIW